MRIQWASTSVLFQLDITSWVWSNQQHAVVRSVAMKNIRILTVALHLVLYDGALSLFDISITCRFVNTLTVVKWQLLFALLMCPLHYLTGSVLNFLKLFKDLRVSNLWVKCSFYPHLTQHLNKNIMYFNQKTSVGSVLRQTVIQFPSWRETK